MTYSIDSKNIKGILNLVINIEGEEELLIPTELDKQGMDLLLEDIGEFIEDAMWDVTSMIIQESGEAPVLGLVLDMYKGEDDSDPITTTFWYEDYLPVEEDDDSDEPKILKMKD